VSATYKTPAALDAALKERQRRRAREQGVPFNRLAQTDMYFRFLERVLRELGDGAVVVKGGVALEMRLQRARTTLDVDLRVLGPPNEIYERIRAAGLRDHGDFLSFQVVEWRGDIEGDGVVYEGRRFRVQAMMAGKPYRDPFGLDIAFGDPMIGPPDKIIAPDAFSFAGISPPTIPIYPLGTHLAEKLHAYTLPRERANSRLKDLVDIALVAKEPALKPSPVIWASTISQALEQTFAARKSHDLPQMLPSPPEAWRARYVREKSNNNLPWGSIDDVHAEAARFLNPVLQGTARGTWDPNTTGWSLELAILHALPQDLAPMGFHDLASKLDADVGVVASTVHRLADAGDPLVDIISDDQDGVPIELLLTGRGQVRLRRSSSGA